MSLDLIQIAHFYLFIISIRVICLSGAIGNFELRDKTSHQLVS